MKRFLSLALLLSASISYAGDEKMLNVPAPIRHDPRCEERGVLELYTLLKNRDTKALDELYDDLKSLKEEYQTNEQWYGTRTFDARTLSYIYDVHNAIAERNNPEELALMKRFSKLFGYTPGKNYNKQ